MKSLNKRGVFGLTSVQAFFAVLLGVALLAYVIVVVMGILDTSTILPGQTTTVNNESSYINSTGDFLADALTASGFSNPTILVAINATSGAVISSTLYSLTSNGIVYNATSTVFSRANITYSYSFNTAFGQRTDIILGNTSNGITGFFSAINPIYAILAILVIILILVVLVRVVTGGGIANQRANPQL